MAGGIRRVPQRLPLLRASNWINQIAKDCPLIPHDTQPSAIWRFGRRDNLGNRLAEPGNQHRLARSTDLVENG